MRTLILMRHAKAAPPHEAGGDEARALTERGEREAAEAGKALAEAGLKPDLALVSTAERTRRTFAAAAPAGAAQFERALYMASPETIWRAFAANAAACVLVIGHNPGVGELAAQFVHLSQDRSRLAREVSQNFPTAAWAAFAVDAPLLRAANPKLLAAWRPERD